MVLRVVFKTKQSPRSRLLCIQLRILTLSLHRHQPRRVPAVPIVQVARGELALRDRLLEDGVVLQNIFITRDIRKQGSRPSGCCKRHFPLSCIAGYNLTQDRIIHVSDVQRRELANWGNQSWEREEETTSERTRACPRVASPQQFEDLLNSTWFNLLVGCLQPDGLN